MVKVFWYDSYRDKGVDSEDAEEMTLDEACLVWSDQVPGIQGSFFGLIDETGQALQFYVAKSLPDHVGDTGHLENLDLDIPCPKLSGSFSARIKYLDVYPIINRVYEKGIDYRDYDVSFSNWHEA